MKGKEKLVLIIFFIVLIIAIILIILISLNNKNQKEIFINGEEVIVNPELEGTEGNLEYNNHLSDIITKYDYYNVKYCSEMYQQAINDLLDNNNTENRLKLYQMLDEEYVNENNISTNNVNNIYNNYQKSEVLVDKILSTQLSNSVKAYLVKGKTVSNNNRNECVLIVKLDVINNTFSILPYEYIVEKNYNDLENGEILNIQNDESISNKTNNVYEDQSNNYTTISEAYYEKLKNDILYDPEYLYNILDEQYKEARFGNYQNFENYVNSYRNIIVNGQAIQSYREYYDGYVQYICVDGYNNYFIFNETSTLNYTVQLDNYTIETEDFKTKYETASNETKISTNIDKLMQMINTKDYQTAYNLLDTTYKNNNFPTLNDYINYINNNFFNFNYYAITNISEQGPYYVVTVLCKENAAASAESRTKQIIIALGEGTNFTMSFAL